MEIQDLIGCQLLSIDNQNIVVKKGDKVHVLHIQEDEGGCCGFNDIETSLFVSSEELNRNPVITNVSVLRDDYDCDEETCKVTFFGELKELAEVKTLSSSGSGWCYGATVSLVCNELGLNETLSSW